VADIEQRAAVARELSRQMAYWLDAQMTFWLDAPAGSVMDTTGVALENGPSDLIEWCRAACDVMTALADEVAART
jgi:hypothetical protein